MLVFAASPTARVKYILDELLTRRLGIAYKLTDSAEYFRKSQSIKLHYGNYLIESCLNIPCTTLLFEDHIIEQKIKVIKNDKWLFQFYHLPYENIPDFKNQTSSLTFDFLAATFYLLSRYEEYLPNHRDEHNRFKHQNSLAYKNNFLDIPLIDYWVIQFAKLIKTQYPELNIISPQYKQVNTIDIDFAYKYKGHSFFALSRKYTGSLLRGKPDLKSIFIPKKDPYDTYEFLISTTKNKNVETLFFLLLANYGGFDKNIPPLSKEMRSLAAELSQNFNCGIHPSYRSELQPDLYQLEHEHFEVLTGHKPVLSRNHFLKIKVPDSYELLDKTGIEKDYSMSYAGSTGFRASTSFPFQLFNLHHNKTHNCWVYSPCVMDVVLKNNLKLKPEQAIEKINELKAEVKKVNGHFISIWHNSSFDAEQGWEGWEQVYSGLFE